MLVSAGSSLKFWNENSLHLIQDVSLAAGGLTTLTWNNSGHFLASLTQASNEISFFAISGESAAINNILSIIDEPRCLQFANLSPRFLGLAGCKGKLLIWDIKSQETKKSFSVPTSSLNKISFSQNDSYIAVGTEKGEAFFISDVYNSISKPLQIFSKEVSVTDLQYSMTNKSLLGAAGNNGSVALIDHNTGSIVKSFPEVHSAPASSLAFSPFNQLLLLSAGFDKKLKSFDVSSKREVLSHSCQSPLSCVTFLDSGHLIALGTMTGEIFIHDLRSFKHPVTNVSAYRSPITSLKIQPKPKEKSSKVSTSSSKRVSSHEKTKYDSSTNVKRPSEKMEASIITPLKSPATRPSPSLEMLSPVRLKISASSEKELFPKAATPLSLRNQPLYDSFEMFSPPRKTSQAASPQMKENICRKNLLLNRDAVLPSKPENTPEKMLNSSQRAFIDDLLSPVRNDSLQDFTSVRKSPLKIDALMTNPLINLPEKENGSACKSTNRSNQTESKLDVQPLRNYISNVESMNKKDEGNLDPSMIKDSENMFFTPLNADVSKRVHFTPSSDAVSPPPPQPESTKPSESKENDTKIFKCNTPIVSPPLINITHIDPPKKIDNLSDKKPLKNESFPLMHPSEVACPTCGRNGDGDLSSYDSEDLQKIFMTALEAQKFDTSQKFTNLQFMIVKNFFNLKKDLKKLIEENSLNDELLLENERLREEIEILRNTH